MNPISLKDIAYNWCYDNLTNEPPVQLLTQPMKYYPHPVDAFVAGVQYANQHKIERNRDKPYTFSQRLCILFTGRCD